MQKETQLLHLASSCNKFTVEHFVLHLDRTSLIWNLYVTPVGYTTVVGHSGSDDSIKYELELVSTRREMVQWRYEGVILRDTRSPLPGASNCHKFVQQRFYK